MGRVRVCKSLSLFFLSFISLNECLLSSFFSPFCFANKPLAWLSDHGLAEWVAVRRETEAHRAPRGSPNKSICDPDQCSEASRLDFAIEGCVA